MADNETIADILAEMRGIRVREFQDYADRLEAAHRREVDEAERRANHAAMKNVSETLAKVGPLYDAESIGNAAKFYEAQLSIKADILKRRSENVYYITDSDILEKIDAALAAPPRNCDAMDWRTAWKIWREKFLPETPVGYSAVVKGTEAFMDWFTAPAQTKEGGAK